ncbi:MAG: heparinase II/III family protein [Anaerolineales bacterium]
MGAGQSGICKENGSGKLTSVIAEHDGYAALGLVHRREVSTEANRWLITDRLLPKKDPKKKLLARLHWLLPDWDWQLAGQRLQLESPHGVIEISIDASVGDDCSFQIVRAGEFGSRTAEPIAGWFSPTYGVKVPALSFIIEATGLLPITLTTTWTLPD